MEGQETPKTPEEQLEEFRAEIKAIKDAEMAKKKAWEERGRTGEAYDPHFDQIKPEFLEQPERMAYAAVEADQMTAKELRWLHHDANRAAAERFGKREESPQRQSVNDFWGFLTNRFMGRKAPRRKEERNK